MAKYDAIQLRIKCFFYQYYKYFGTCQPFRDKIIYKYKLTGKCTDHSFAFYEREVLPSVIQGGHLAKLI
jgi:hypothetical protein